MSFPSNLAEHPPALWVGCPLTSSTPPTFSSYVKSRHSWALALNMLLIILTGQKRVPNYNSSIFKSKILHFFQIMHYQPVRTLFQGIRRKPTPTHVMRITPVAHYLSHMQLARLQAFISLTYYLSAQFGDIGENAYSPLRHRFRCIRARFPSAMYQ
jgi:hypothetical protein